MLFAYSICYYSKQVRVLHIYNNIYIFIYIFIYLIVRLQSLPLFTSHPTGSYQLFYLLRLCQNKSKSQCLRRSLIWNVFEINMPARNAAAQMPLYYLYMYMPAYLIYIECIFEICQFTCAGIITDIISGIELYNNIHIISRRI